MKRKIISMSALFILNSLLLTQNSKAYLEENNYNTNIITTETANLDISPNTEIKPKSYVLKVPTLSQIVPDFIPMGCECVAENMALKFKGVTNLSSKDLIDNMNNSDNPKLGFIGDMYSFKNYRGTIPAVWPERIITQVKQFRPNSYYSNSLTAEQLENEIANNNPVMVWYSWEKVDKALIVPGEFNPIMTSNGLHCTLLVGYDEKNWYFNDPAYGKVRKLDKNEFYAKYLAYGMKSVVIK